MKFRSLARLAGFTLLSGAGAPLGGGDFILHAPDQAMRTTSLSRPISSSLIMPRSMYSRVSGTPGQLLYSAAFCLEFHTICSAGRPFARLGGHLCCGWRIFAVFAIIIWKNAIIFGDYEGIFDVYESGNADSVLGIGVSDQGITISVLGIGVTDQGITVSDHGITDSDHGIDVSVLRIVNCQLVNADFKPADGDFKEAFSDFKPANGALGQDSPFCEHKKRVACHDDQRFRSDTPL